MTIQLFHAYLLYLFLVLSYGFFYYKNFPKYSKSLVSLIFVTFCLELVSRIFIHYYTSSCPSYHILIALQFWIFTNIYSQLINYSTKTKRIIRILSIAAIITVVLISIFIQSMLTFPTYGFSLISLFVVINSVLGFNKMISNPELISLFKQPAFWFNLGNLTFFSFTFFSFGFF